MPDLWTHILCGNRILNNINIGYIRDTVNERRKIFKFGTQGPDMFYYYRFIPGLKPKNLRDFGRIMHTENTGDFIVKGLEYLKDIGNEEDFKNLFTYLFGYICHFSLDRTAHPYILYCSNLYSKYKRGRYWESIFHKRIETVIDAVMVNEFIGENAKGIPGYEEIDIGAKLPRFITDFYQRLLNDVYGFKIDAGFINKAYSDMKKGLKIIFDPMGKKLKLLSFAEKITHNKLMYSFVFYPDINNIENEYLNNDHALWNHPEDEHCFYTWSFRDLFDVSVEEGREMVEAAWEYVNSRLTKKEIISFFPNQSYLTGRLT